MVKLLVIGLCLLFGISLLAVPAQAVTKSLSTPTATPTPQVTPVNSFEVFWPIVAGRTVEDSFYRLKLLKEEVRGFLIFSPGPRAEYAVFRATKRVVEAEKLIQNGKDDATTKTIESALLQLKVAADNMAKAKESGQAAKSTTWAQMLARLQNIKKLAQWLGLQETGELRSKLEELELAADGLLKQSQ